MSGYLEIFMVAISLAMDCFAVSVAGGALVKKPRIGNALKIGGFFGGFQAVMPLIGWGIGFGFKKYIENYDHWIAFALLLGIGAKMIIESFKKEEDKKEKNILANFTLFVLAVATSIDALIIGLGISIFKVPIAYSVLIIGSFAFLLSVTGYFIGHKVGKFLKNRAELAGGIVLIGIGAKILIEHLL
jgi:manganese efflux pump family protein